MYYVLFALEEFVLSAGLKFWVVLHHMGIVEKEYFLLLLPLFIIEVTKLNYGVQILLIIIENLVA